MSPRITINTSIRGGQPTLRNMRITVYDVLKMLASGMTHEAILADFPELTAEDIFASLLFASQREAVSTRSFYDTTSRPKSFA
jgi:uncharacterized protein (DUF433 family)